jgi:hypothetical protein
MCDDNIEIGVTEITNNILVSATATDQIIDINVLEEVENVELTITPSVVEVNIEVTQELITEEVTIDANTCVNIIDVSVTDATDNVTLNITPSLVEVNINRGENNLSIEEYETFDDLPTIGDTDTYYITLDDNKFWRWDSIDEVYVEISDSDDKVPYLGAIDDVDLGEFGIKAGWFGLDNTPTTPPNVAGTITWNNSDGTADLILKGGNVTLQIGQEQVVRVVNKTGATLTEAAYKVVRIRTKAEGGAQGQRLAVLLAQANTKANHTGILGLVTETISNNQEGFITTFGNVSKINTTGSLQGETWEDGDVLWLSATTAGNLTNIEPSVHPVLIGYVVYAHANNGKIFVTNGQQIDELNELHDVNITSAVNKDALIYNSATSVWENKPLSSFLTASAPLSLTSNVLSISEANATTDGYISLEDWNYFSAKQQALSGTGFVKISGSTISYDNTIYTPQSRTLTINGDSYDLSADRSWSISVGSGMRNVSSFVATGGQTTFTIVGGYTAGLVDVFVNGARLNSADYTATNGTTVVLAIGVVANDIVDIINYVASLTSGLTGAGTTNYIAKWSGSSALTNSLIFDNGTNVGIGTASPTSGYALDVVGSILSRVASGNTSIVVQTNNANGAFNAIAGTGLEIATDGTNQNIVFRTGVSEKMRILANGNVGINTTSPSQKLDVNGAIKTSGNFFSVNNTPFSSNGTITYHDTVGLVLKGATGFSFDFSIYNPAGNVLIGNPTGTNNVVFSGTGMVGIGLSNPTYKLDVVGDARITGQFNLINNNIIFSDAATGHTYHTFNRSSSTWEQMLRWRTAGSDRWYIGIQGGAESFGIYGAVAGANAITITTSNNVGIGTTSPNATLSVLSNSSNSWGLSLYGRSVDNASTINFFNNAASTRYGFIYSDNTIIQIGTVGAIPLAISTNGVERIRIAANGGVGIGTTNPTEILNVYTAQIKWLVNLQHGNGTQFFVNFLNPSGGQVGSIMGNGTTTSYNITSDYRVKEDLKPIKGLEQVSKINVYDFKFKNSTNRMDGVIAHELQEVLPYAVTGIKDGKNMQSVDYSKIVPILVQSIKELNAEVQLLKAK